MNDNINQIKQHISIAAYYLAQENHPYDTLCWMLAERELYIQNNFTRPGDNYIRKRAAEIFYSSPAYDVLCWLISEKEIFLKSRTRKSHSKTSFFG